MQDTIPGHTGTIPLNLDGLGEGDSAWITTDGCRGVGLVIGGSWISLSIGAEDLTALAVDDDSLRLLAQAIVEASGMWRVLAEASR